MIRITELARNQIAGYVQKGDLAVDATAGKGRDTLFLAELVGPGGSVYAFDIQQEALVCTAALLRREGQEDRVTLIHDGHESMASYVDRPVAAVMFNLGYLPGGDRSIVTGPESSLQGLEAALHLLKPGGIVTLVLYPGHEGGKGERGALLDYCRSLDSARYRVLHAKLLNSRGDPPELLAVKGLEGALR